MKPRYSYKEHGHDQYYGRRFFQARECARDNQYRVEESILVRNEEGMLGFVGSGPIWAMNYMTGTGSCCFNPIKPEDIVWSGYHHAYIWKSQTEHFKFPVIIGAYYYLIDGKKTDESYHKIGYPELPVRGMDAQIQAEFACKKEQERQQEEAARVRGLETALEAIREHMEAAGPKVGGVDRSWVVDVINEALQGGAANPAAASA